MTKNLIGIVALSLLVSGCASFYPAGFIYTEAKMGVQANGKKGPKTGKACIRSVLGIVATGDASVQAAMNDGNITRINTVDYEVKNILGFTGEYCIVVSGE
jgi:hypothetical protein